MPYIPHREPTWAERLVAAAAPPDNLEAQTKRVRMATPVVSAGGGDAPVAPAPEAVPIAAPPAMDGDVPYPEDEEKEYASTADEAKS